MNSQQEYEQFMAKLLKSARELQNDFNNLSEENKKRILEKATAFLRGYGYVINVEELMRKWVG